MARRKTSLVPGQLSLFDDIAKIEHTQHELHAENTKENNLLEEILYGSRQTNSTPRHSTQSSQSEDNKRSLFDRRTYSHSLMDFGQVGTQQPREASSTGAIGLPLSTPTPVRSGETGRESDGFGGVQRPRVDGALQVGNLPDDRDRDRTGVNPKNFRLDPTALGTGGAKTKFQDNIQAIKTLNDLNHRNAKFASDGEQKILARYVGWGGLAQAFDKDNTTWEKEYKELKGLLSQEDYEKARRSTQDAHFTSATIIDGMYRGLARIGVNQADNLKILEPSAGIGHFIGLKPETFKADFYTVEQDPLSAKILDYLYPKEHNIQASYQDLDFGSSIFDVTIGNPPFGNQKLFDRNNPHLNDFSIHNYFIAKSMDCAKEGGVGAFVVSRYFMDSHNGQHRDYIAENSHFLGAVRLPHTAFKENALTDVTTDIVFLQKKTALEKEQGITRGYDMTRVEQQYVFDQQSQANMPAYYNKYFIDHPEQILGKMEYTSGQFGEELKCVPPEKQILDMSIINALQALPRNVFDKTIVNKENKIQASSSTEKEQNFIRSEYFQSLKPNSYVIVPGQQKVYEKEKDDFLQDTLKPVETKSVSAFNRINGMIEIRDTLRTLINLEKSNEADTVIEDKRRLLNARYDQFQKSFGFLNSTINKSLFKFDPESSLIQSLEKNYDKGISKEQAEKSGRIHKEPSATKSDIFFKRVLRPIEEATHADNAKDALAICLREKGMVDFARIASLVNSSAENVQSELQNERLVFLNPTSQLWEIKDKYLTGNVKEKLAIAEKYAEAQPDKYHTNVTALKEVIPMDIEAVDIGVRLGSSWVPPSDVLQFIRDEIGQLNEFSTQLDYIPLLGKWDAKIQIRDFAANREIWGTPNYHADDLIQSILTNRPIKVEKELGRDDFGKMIKEIDQEATAVAMQKAKSIEQAFNDWIWKDDERRAKLSKVYNDKFNTHVVPKYDGSHVELVGASESISLRSHQKNAVWRAMQEGTALFDHVVGAGKTLAATAMVKESKRMGLFNKPMIVVPNHLVYQWRDEFYRLYPDANILVATKEDFLKQNRERFFSRVATNDWDAVIVAHSSFKKIDMPKQIEQEILQEQITATMDALSSLKENNGSRATIKQLEKQKERITERYDALIAGAGAKDKSVDFSDLGIDSIIVDEAHEFKNLNFTTTMNVSGLGNVTGSAKALDLFIKCRYLQRENEGKGVYFLTGTPISNSISEIYTLQRYMQFDELSKKGLEYFDSWASTFAKVSSDWELDATGVNYKLKSRFSKFDNVPELLSMYRSFADVVTKEDIDKQLAEAGFRSNTPPLLSGKPISHIAERSESQAKFMEQIIDRMENLPSDPREDNPLKITNDARKAGLDMRLIDPDEHDVACSKVNACADRIFQIWQSSKEDKGTQLVFCDLSTPKSQASTEEQKGLTFTEEAFANEKIELTEKDEFAEKDDEKAVKEVNMDEVLASLGSGNFSIYNDLKTKLMEKGIPSHEIAFIHDANTDQRKSKLFGEVNNGDVRVLLGSTAKMGAGMNVQTRLVAAHHLDCPWRPSDLEQRNGRIIRQGNQLHTKDPDNFQIGIYYYATKQTYDARMWQTIQYKATAIEQFRKGDLLQRQIDDVRSEAATAAEMKAAASGNPLILMEVNISNELKNLEALFTEHNRSKHRQTDKIKYLEGAPERLKQAEEKYASNIALRDENTRKITENGKEKIVFELYREGKFLRGDDKDEIQAIISKGVHETTLKQKTKDFLLGNYRGFDVHINRSHFASAEHFEFSITGKNDRFSPANFQYSVNEDFSLTGLFQRFDNLLEKGLDARHQQDVKYAQKDIENLPNMREAFNRGFEHQDELSLARKNHENVILELQKTKEDKSYVSEWQPMTLEEYRKQSSEATMQNSSPADSQTKIQANNQADQKQSGSTNSETRYPPIENAFSSKLKVEDGMLVDKQGNRFRMK